MFILLTIILLIVIPIAMLVLRLVRPKLSIQGLLAALAVVSGVILIFLARSEIPQLLPLLKWKPESLFTTSPVLLVDEPAWYFALALVALSFSVVITSIAELGQSSKPEIQVRQEKPRILEAVNSSKAALTATPSEPTKSKTPSDWLFWAAILILTCAGLVAVTAGNLLTLLMAWAALDIIELIILVSQVLQSKQRERAVFIFSANLAGMAALVAAGIVSWSHNESFTFDAITQSTSGLMVLAAGLRLGVLPLQLPFTQGLPVRRGLGTALRLIPAVSSYILLVRVSNTGVTGIAGIIFLGLSTLTGLFASINWLRATDEQSGRPYWLLGISSLVMIAAITGQPSASLSWSIAGMLSGGLIFCLSLRQPSLLPLVLLGAFNLSSLPFSPTWQVTALYQYSSSTSFNVNLFSFFSILFLLMHAFLLAGFIRHSLRGIYPASEASGEHIERWVWLLYPIALILLVALHLFIGWLLYPSLNGLAIQSWLIGPITLILACFILYISWRTPRSVAQSDWMAAVPAFWNQLFSFTWLYRMLWRFFRVILKILSLISSILEGEAGILWALVLFALIFVFMQK